MGTSYKELKHLRLSVDGKTTPDSHREIACLETSSFSATANCVSPFSLRKATSFSFNSMFSIPILFHQAPSCKPQAVYIKAIIDCLSLSRNPVCTQEQTGSRTYMSEKTAKRNEDNRSLHFHVANFFKFMATNLSFTQFVT